METKEQNVTPTTETPGMDRRKFMGTLTMAGIGGGLLFGLPAFGETANETLAGDFHSAIAATIQQKPKEAAVVAKHVDTHYVGKYSHKPFEKDNAQSLIDAANEHHDLLISGLQSPQFRESMSALVEAYQANPNAPKIGLVSDGQGRCAPVLLPLIIALAVADAVIWGYIALKGKDK